MLRETRNVDELKAAAARLREEILEDYKNPPKFVEGSDLGGAVKTLALVRPAKRPEGAGAPKVASDATPR